MEAGLQKKYGLITAIAMVVGIVIGSGVFLKAEKVLTATGGDLKLGILAWVIGGIIKISCAYTFAVMATKYEKVNGIVDYAEGANLTKPWFGFFCFDSSELPIVTIYALYIPIFIMIMKKEKDLSSFKRFIMPTISLAGCIFMIIAACFSHKMEVVAYLIIFAIIMAIGALFSKKVNLN